MTDIFDYIDNYGNDSFEQREFNDIDNVIFSVLSYIDYTDILTSYCSKKTIEEVAFSFFSSIKSLNVKKEISAVRNAVRVLENIKNKKRYKDTIVFHHLKKASDKTQFKAISFLLPNNTIYIAFEGTDHLLSGWEEDCKISYKFPVECQNNAIKYINRYLFTNSKLIIGGHSKGGNLAIISSMYCNFVIQNRIIKIYSNDGLGIRKEQLNSSRYLKVLDRIIEIVPNYSIVGKLLYHGKNQKIVMSTTKTPFCHNPNTWVTNKTEFLETEPSKFSIVVEKTFTKWLDKYTSLEKEKFTKCLFDLCRIYQIKSIKELKEKKTLILKVVRSSKNIDKDVKKMIKELFDTFLLMNKELKKSFK